MSVPADRVRVLFDRYRSTFAAGDADALAALHAVDGVLHVRAGERPVRGRVTIAARFRALFDTWPTLQAVPRSELVGDGAWVLAWTLVVPAVGAAGSGIALDCLDVVALDEDGLVLRKDTWLDAGQYASVRWGIRGE